MLISFAAAGFWFLVFAISFWRDRRLFKNGIFLVLTLMFAGLGVIFALEAVNRTAARVLVVAILVAIPVAIAVLAVFLVVNGVTMLRREGRRPANLLSLLAGLGIIGFVIFSVAVQKIGWEPLAAVRSALIGVLTYISFLFVCFLAVPSCDSSSRRVPSSTAGSARPARSTSSSSSAPDCAARGSRRCSPADSTARSRCTTGPSAEAARRC